MNALRPVEASAPVPVLSEVLADRALLNHLPPDALVDLRRQIGYLGADVDAALARHTMRAEQHPTPVEVERLLSPAEAASTFGVKVRWLLEHADDIPGTRRLSRKVIRFSARGLRRYLGGSRV